MTCRLCHLLLFLSCNVQFAICTPRYVLLTSGTLHRTVSFVDLYNNNDEKKKKRRIWTDNSNPKMEAIMIQVHFRVHTVLTKFLLIRNSLKTWTQQRVWDYLFRNKCCATKKSLFSVPYQNLKRAVQLGSMDRHFESVENREKVVVTREINLLNALQMCLFTDQRIHDTCVCGCWREKNERIDSIRKKVVEDGCYVLSGNIGQWRRRCAD